MLAKVTRNRTGSEKQRDVHIVEPPDEVLARKVRDVLDAS
jgi:hypothetical protein